MGVKKRATGHSAETVRALKLRATKEVCRVEMRRLDAEMQRLRGAIEEHEDRQRGAREGWKVP